MFTIMKYEFKSLIKSGPATIALLIFTALVWSNYVSNQVESIEEVGSFLWVISYAFVMTAGISYSVFIRERTSGALEILLTSGIERLDIIRGKIAFATIVSSLMGVVSFGVAFIIKYLIFKADFFSYTELTEILGIYVGSTVFITSLSAFYSLLLKTPRLMQFLNFITLGILSFIYILFDVMLEIPLWYFALFLMILSSILNRITSGLFLREQVIEQIVF